MTTAAPQRSFRPLVIGVGNTDCADDGVGPVAVRALHRIDPSIDVLVREGDLTTLPLYWEGREHVVIVDACATGAPLGELVVVDPDRLETGSALSTHGLGVREAIKLAEHLGRLPDRLTIAGIEGRSFGPGPMSDDLANMLPDLVRRLGELVRRHDGRSGVHGADAPSSAR